MRNFKKEVGITDRAITHFVTRRQLETDEEIRQKARNFVEDTKNVMEEYADENVFNVDQSGFRKEHRSQKSAIWIL